MDYRKIFNSMFPGFFEEAGIKGLPKDSTFTELIMNLRADKPSELPYEYAGGTDFCVYRGELETLKDAVRRVDGEWTKFFDEKTRSYCAMDGDKIAAFCILEDWGMQDTLRIGGPGCVGTLPEYRKKGIGLEMVRRATMLLKEEGVDISWIHYTHLAHWYEKLGYRTILEWNSEGFL